MCTVKQGFSTWGPFAPHLERHLVMSGDISYQPRGCNAPEWVEDRGGYNALDGSIASASGAQAKEQCSQG